MGMVDFNLSDIGGLFTSAREAITGKRILDPVEMAKIELQFEQLGNAIASGQMKINEEEAKNPNLFIAGWRPAVGWVGVTALFFMYIPKAIVMTAAWCYSVYITFENAGYGIIPVLPPFPDLGAMDIIGLLCSILGVGIMRSWDKKNNVDTKVIGK